MDNKKAIMFLARIILNIGNILMRGGVMEYEEYLKMESLAKGDFSAFEDKEEQES